MFDRNSKLCRRCHRHRKLAATVKLKEDLATRIRELTMQIERAGQRAGVQPRQIHAFASASPGRNIGGSPNRRFLKSTPVRSTLEQMQPRKDSQGEKVSPAVAVSIFFESASSMYR